MPYKNPEDDKACRLRNRAKKLAYMKRYRLANIERERARTTAWRAQPENLAQSRDQQKAYGKANRARRRTYERKYRKMRRETDMNQRILERLRSRVHSALKLNRKSASTIQLLGCDIQFLRGYLEARFQPGMTWANHGKWHIDHHIPCAEFDLRDEAQQRQCFHYSNLKPMWGIENIRKGAKRPATHQGELV